MEDENTGTAGTEGAEASTPVEPATHAAESPAEWDGSPTTLATQPWVPESARPHIERHLTEYESTRARATFLNRLFDADDRTAEYARTLQEREVELASLKQALEAAGKERDEYKGRFTSIEQERANERLDREYERVKAAYPDIHADYTPDEKDPAKGTGAWATFIDLMNKGFDEATAAKMARATLPASSAPAAPAASAAPAKRAVQVPPAIQAAAKGGNNPSATVNAAEANESFDQRTRRLEREARERGE